MMFRQLSQHQSHHLQQQSVFKLQDILSSHQQQSEHSVAFSVTKNVKIWMQSSSPMAISRSFKIYIVASCSFVLLCYQKKTEKKLGQISHHYDSCYMCACLKFRVFKSNSIFAFNPL